MNSAIKVLVVAREGVVREGLKSILRRQRDFEAASLAAPERLLMLADRVDCDVLLLDWGCVPGLPMLWRLCVAAPARKVVVVGVDQSSDELHEALEAGAVGCVARDASAEDLVRAVYAAAKKQ